MIDNAQKVRTEVYCVTYWDDSEEPVVTIFDNEEAANKCYDYFKMHHEGCCIDSCEIYSSFSIT